MKMSFRYLKEFSSECVCVSQQADIKEFYGAILANLECYIYSKLMLWKLKALHEQHMLTFI